MRIIVDAMGGDLSPKSAVEGALAAVKERPDLSITLVGPGEQLLGCLNELGLKEIPKGIEITHASQVISSEEDPTSSIRNMKDSSMVVALNLLSKGEGDALVSSGSTGALLTGATLLVKRIHGIRRAALATILPAKEGPVLLMDCGANAECTPEYLMQFAYMGRYYVSTVLGIQNPRVALLNNGTEEKKGTQVHQQTHQLLKKANQNGSLRFVGNIEARDILSQKADVVVSDGFTGNAVLKSIEGTAIYLGRNIKKMFLSSLKTKIAALLVKKELGEFKKLMDYTEVGGAPLLGISKPVIKAHGSSDSVAFKNAILQAESFAKSATIDSITKDISQMKANLSALDKDSEEN